MRTYLWRRLFPGYEGDGVIVAKGTTIKEAKEKVLREATAFYNAKYDPSWWYTDALRTPKDEWVDRVIGGFEECLANDPVDITAMDVVWHHECDQSNIKADY